MKKLLHSIFSICLFLSAETINAQDNGKGDVVIHSDSRLTMLLERSYSNAITPHVAASLPPETTGKPVTDVNRATTSIVNEPKTAYYGKGYRVQVYNGPDRAKAIAIKTACMRRFQGVNTYLMYIAPAFRVKIGDYRLRSDAEQMLRAANTLYRPSMIVPDMVTVSAN